MVFVIANISVNTVFAGSLDKYGGSSRYKSAPAVKNPREEAIDKAVVILNSKTGEERKNLVEQYQQRINTAVKNKSYDEARFYAEILKRSGDE